MHVNEGFSSEAKLYIHRAAIIFDWLMDIFAYTNNLIANQERPWQSLPSNPYCLTYEQNLPSKGKVNDHISSQIAVPFGLHEMDSS